MSLARSLATILSGGSVPAAKVSGLGALATKSSVGVADAASDLAKLTPKAWALINGANGSVLAGVGLTAVRNSTGAFTMTLGTNAPNVSYGVVITGAHSGNLTVDEDSSSARTTSVFKVRSRNTSTGSVADPYIFTVAVYW